MVIIARDGGGIDSPALKKMVKHAHNLLMKEVNVVQTLGKDPGVSVLFC